MASTQPPHIMKPEPCKADGLSTTAHLRKVGHATVGRYGKSVNSKLINDNMA
nr:MAG TPA: hypothetical protein [Caudoviricetes sp.]